MRIGQLMKGCELYRWEMRSDIEGFVCSCIIQGHSDVPIGWHCGGGLKELFTNVWESLRETKNHSEVTWGKESLGVLTSPGWKGQGKIVIQIGQKSGHFNATCEASARKRGLSVRESSSNRSCGLQESLQATQGDLQEKD